MRWPQRRKNGTDKTAEDNDSDQGPVKKDGDVAHEIDTFGDRKGFKPDLDRGKYQR